MMDILYNLIITPIELIVEMTYSIMVRILDNKGLAIIAVSLVIQTLILPLYKRADALQEEERKKQEEMAGWVNHIKKTFKGDERFMMLQTYYRQQNYKTYYALKSSFSILLQVPFFMAAYNYLSHLGDLKGASFLFINDLGAPDGLFTVMGFTVNILPILMTLVNIVSGIIYTKGFPLKSKMQVYGLALVFLVLLYNSPAGLVVYWLMNNCYSLFKNIFTKLVKDTIRAIGLCVSAAGLIIMAYTAKIGVLGPKKTIACIGLIVLGIVVPIILKKRKAKPVAAEIKPKTGMFVSLMLIMTVIMGALSPLMIISSSAIEFIADDISPVSYVVNTLSVWAGVFIVWGMIFYMLMSKKTREKISLIVYGIVGVCVVNFMAFGVDGGVMDYYLVFEETPVLENSKILINIVVIIAVFAVMLVLYKKFKNIAYRLAQVVLVCMVVLSGVNLVSVNSQVNVYFEAKNRDGALHKDSKILPLSKDKENVIVFMLDRAFGSFIPYILEDYPELKTDFDGFTCYPNTVSFGVCTNFATPALFGGYEYTPTEINKRTEESLEEKQNEALSVLPVLFSQNGYNVTVCDPPYAGYEWVPDISIYDEYEGINAYVTQAQFDDEIEMFKDIPKVNRDMQESNFVYYGVMRIMPVGVRNFVYNNGNYFSAAQANYNIDAALSDEENAGTTFYEVGRAFYEDYSVLLSLPEMTYIDESGKGSFLMIQNATTHEPYIMQLPDYMPSTEINVAAELANEREHVIDGNRLALDNERQLAHYRTNITALKTMAKWFDYLRENDLYDNTRIILVADHSYPTGNLENGVFKEFPKGENFNPLLMVKDFNATGFKISDEFMTNADTPTLAVENVIQNPINPFTGKLITNTEKTAHPQRITDSRLYDVKENNGNVFDTSDMDWFEVQDNIFKGSNWKKAGN